MNLLIKKIAVAIFATTALLVAASFPRSTRAVITPLDEGQDIFKTKCAICHGADGSGNTAMGKQLKVRDLRAAEVQKQSDAQLSSVIAKGKGKMTPFEKMLSPDQIHQVVNYIRQLKKG